MLFRSAILVGILNGTISADGGSSTSLAVLVGPPNNKPTGFDYITVITASSFLTNFLTNSASLPGNSGRK